MFDWLGDLISGIGDAIGGAFDYIGESIANTIFNSILQWLYEIIYGAISDFFEMIGNMGAEIFDLSWVQATVRLFTLFGWSLFAVGTVVAIFDVAIEYQNGRVNIKTACINILKGFFALQSDRSCSHRAVQVLYQPAEHVFSRFDQHGSRRNQRKPC